MTGTNHIAGGFVITGIFSSFWDINIFSEPTYMATTFFFSLLPDIDHRKSLIGKAFTPIARYLDRNFGHRTITHSFIFIIIMTILATFVENLFSNDHTFTLIVFFSILTHYLLDMVTVQGIPLFYPFKRNPCVIPGNPHMRLKTGDVKSEVAGFIVFLLLGLSLMPLYKNGFWTSYNRAFGTVQHVNRENKKSPNFINCEYSYIRNNNEHTGVGLVVYSDDDKLKIFNNNQLFTIATDDKHITINYAKPIPTAKPKIFKEIQFFSIPIDSLLKILDNKIVSGVIQSSQKVYVMHNTIMETRTLIKLDYDYNIKILTMDDTLGNKLLDRIKLKEMQIEKDINHYTQKQTELKNLQKQLQKIQQDIKHSSDIYDKNSLQKRYQEVENQIKKFNLEKYAPNLIQLYELQILKNQYQDISRTLFSGVVEMPDFN